jgi:site-specific DNA recombinase
LFDEVQNVLKGRKNKTKQYLLENPDFPLRRFIFNKQDKPLTGYWAKGKRKKYPYYSFSEPGTTIRKEVLEAGFMELLQCFAFETKHFSFLKERLKACFESTIKNDVLANDAIEKRIEEINNQIDILIKVHGQGGISENIFSVRVKKLEMELDELQELLKAKSNQDISIDDLVKSVTSFLIAPHLFWQKSPVDTRRKIQVFVFPMGLIFDGIKFRTPKLCSVYRLKDIIDAKFDPKADLRVNTKNTLKTYSFTLLSENLLETKAFWETIMVDLRGLSKIMPYQ